MIYFTSDLHFLHKNIIKYNRGYYSSVEEMDEDIIRVINKTTTPQDTLYILGDIAIGSVRKSVELLARIHCTIFIVPGNHDSSRACNRYNELPNVTVLPTLTELKLGSTDIVLCHFPLVVWNKGHHGAWQLFGHTHGSYEGVGKSLDVGWDNYYNLFGKVGIFSLTDVETYMNTRDYRSFSHHSEETA